MTRPWSKRALAKQRWGKNAIAKRRRLIVERALSPQEEVPVPAEVSRIKPARFDVKINIERKDGARIQFTCFRFDTKFMIDGKFIAPKEFGRRLGQILNLWSIA